MEKSQKVAAAREAAEKEKERLAAKAEKEKEEKMRQIAIEKERLKEEHLKKKQLQQLKSHEHEERRKQDEAARLAKLKEQVRLLKNILLFYHLPLKYLVFLVWNRYFFFNYFKKDKIVI